VCRSRRQPLWQPDERLTASRVAPRGRRYKRAAKSQPAERVTSRIPKLQAGLASLLACSSIQRITRVNQFTG
jgi:hypothetical protein